MRERAASRYGCTVVGHNLSGAGGGPCIFEPRKGRETMKINAWIQMGCERREVTFDVTDEEIERVGDDLESFIEEQVLDWIQCRFGWGWSCERIENDFGHMEDGESPDLVATNEVLNPRTERLLVEPFAS